MTIALIILAIAAIAVVGLLIYASMRPDTFHVERSTIIQAPSETISNILTDLRRGVEWSPFEKGRTMEKTFSGPATGVGSSLEWRGDRQSGAGKLTITDVTPSKVSFNLDMIKPIKANNIGEYALAPQNNATNVTWSLSGNSNMISKVMSVFMDMDKMCGGEFEKGLRDLKTLAEGEARRGARPAAA